MRSVPGSQVVQECLANYLLAARPGPEASRAAAAAQRIATCRAFANSGLFGAVATGSGLADKAAVRAKVLGRRTQDGDAA